MTNKNKKYNQPKVDESKKIQKKAVKKTTTHKLSQEQLQKIKENRAIKQAFTKKLIKEFKKAYPDEKLREHIPIDRKIGNLSNKAKELAKKLGLIDPYPEYKPKVDKSKKIQKKAVKKTTTHKLSQEQLQKIKEILDKPKVDESKKIQKKAVKKTTTHKLSQEQLQKIKEIVDKPKEKKKLAENFGTMQFEIVPKKHNSDKIKIESFQPVGFDVNKPENAKDVDLVVLLKAMYKNMKDDGQGHHIAVQFDDVIRTLGFFNKAQLLTKIQELEEDKKLYKEGNTHDFDDNYWVAIKYVRSGFISSKI